MEKLNFKSNSTYIFEMAKFVKKQGGVGPRLVSLSNNKEDRLINSINESHEILKKLSK